MSVKNYFFGHKNTRTKGRYGNRMFGRNDSSVILSKGNRNLFCFCIVRRGSVKVELKFLIVNKNIIFVA